MPDEARRPVYAFPTRSRCPACGGVETYAVSTQGNVQYRKCRRIGCKHLHRAYVVMGRAI